ncbi:hypothetical protein E4U17_000586 [Claviceps sp. LM77 group G4]|nr:hypothetical protein E4U17_000586 [Claviceps sp. LM77 group G4]KAG6059266.1 hypothetical protein E4U33_007141 [Claviceps sp. LM78 group G4]KAG6079728.1 hypothetical protein E4U16_000842 [Claviceps sp. LM84 group G4]
MLRIPCRKSPLKWALQSTRWPTCIRPIRARQPFCSSRRWLVDSTKSTTSSLEAQAKERDVSLEEQQEDRRSVYPLESSYETLDGSDTRTAENSSDDVQGGEEARPVWTTLRERIEASLDENSRKKNYKAEDAEKDEVDPESEGNETNPADSSASKRSRRKTKASKAADVLKAAKTAKATKKANRKATKKASKTQKVAKSPKAPTASKKPKKTVLEVKTIRPTKLELRALDEETTQVPPSLSYDLDRVLFNPGVYHMQDHRSGVFNFDPYLASIMPVEEFDYSALNGYTTSSKDTRLRELCAKHELKYCGSTSSMTSILSHLHFLISAWRKPNFDNLSRSLNPDSQNFTTLSRGPVAAFAHFHNGVYAIDADKEYDKENVLSMLGQSMEKLLTLPKEEFEMYRRSRSHQLADEEKVAETHHYTTLGDFMMRSQLDAHDPRLPGSGIFDLKTRAVVTIRMDVSEYEKGVGYEIRQRFGQWESFEREYCDMIRAAFLKYSLQARMGRMDGIFVAYHNTQRIFGFQYISLAEMDQAIHGTNDTRLGDLEFMCSIKMLNDLLDRATQKFPGRTLRLHVETRPTKVPLTYFFVEPVTDEEMERIQEAGNPSVEQLERDIQDLSVEEREAESVQEAEDAQINKSGSVEESDDLSSSVNEDAPDDDTWREMMSMVDEAVEDESLGVASIRDAVQDALERGGLLQGKTEVERLEYVDDLVSALTAHSTEAKGLGASPDSKDSADEGVPTEKSSLATLILRVTQSVNTKSPNMRVFERKVADLVVQSKDSLDSIPDDQATTETEADEEQATTEVDESDEGLEGEEEDSASADINDESTKDSDVDEPQRELLGMYITIRNKVGSEFVTRPLDISENKEWQVEYTVTELADDSAWRIYSSIKKRRKDVLDSESRSSDWYHMFKGLLPIYTKEGRKYREMKKKSEAGKPVYVAWDTKPLPPDETPGSSGSSGSS